jgi:RNA polymerase sigma factor (sigma-70 family)
MYPSLPGNAGPAAGPKRYDGKGASVDNPDSDAGFAAAFDRYAPAVLRYAQRRLDSQDLAWDVVTETFTAAWRHWDRRPAPADLLPWLYAIAANGVRGQRRSSQRRRRLVTRLTAVARPDAAPDPAEGVVLGRSVGQALAQLPLADQEVLRLIAWEGQTDARTLGLALGLSPGSARSRVHRARRRLRALLDEQDAQPGAAPQPGQPPAAAPIRQYAKEA